MNKRECRQRDNPLLGTMSENFSGRFFVVPALVAGLCVFQATA
jgi:hypothetical protein